LQRWPEMLDVGQIHPEPLRQDDAAEQESEDNDDNGDSLQVGTLTLRQQSNHRLD